jgi:hypothetical protein
MFFITEKAKKKRRDGRGRSASCSSCEGGLKAKQMDDNTGGEQKRKKQMVQEITKGQGR